MKSLCPYFIENPGGCTNKKMHDHFNFTAIKGVAPLLHKDKDCCLADICPDRKDNPRWILNEI